uniref:Uncharacterized protein n=1 Tax=Glossina pallidipes TaxID=7398 RepID=A0A1A9ZEC4_GLOPL
MKSSHTPTKHAIPFGQNGNKRDIPLESKTGSGEASLSLGFPPETMVPKVSGGIPPSGKDFNGILNELSAMGRWANAGAGYPFDAAFANAIGGYPAGAKIPNVENSGFWLNTVDNNLDNPEVADDRLTGRVPAENYGIATLSGLSKADVMLTALQAAKARIVLTGNLKANVAVIFPAWQTSWTVVNQCTGSGSLICRTKAGAGVVVPKGESREIVGDGSGLVPRITATARRWLAVKALADTLSSGCLLNIQSFTKSGIYTPTPGTRKVKVILTGGGASGGSGGAGGTRIAFIDEPIDGTYVTIGAGGEAVTNVGAVGNPGGDSIFGNLMKANGGTTDFGLGGSSSGSGFGIDGGNGTSGGSQGNSTVGGVSYWGGGGTGVNASESLSARAHGSGGAGFGSSSTSSGSGANGICIIEEYS